MLSNEDLFGLTRRSMWLKCSECGILKNGIDDMEIHVKVEHLSWLPFKCLHCGCQRAIASQMREHLHSSHRSDHITFHFVDDSAACNRLRDIMTDTICASLIPKSSTIKKEETSGETTAPSGEILEIRSQIETGIPPTPATPSNDDDNRKRLRIATDSTDTTSSGSYSMAVLLANVASTDEAPVKKVKLEEPEEEEEKIEENEHTQVDQSSLAAFLGALLNGGEMNEGEIEGMEQLKEVKVKKTRSSTVKNCTKCNKPIKSNEKGAHVSFHLSKDFKMNRFQCKIGSCTHESYRKVNIVNHQQKIHGLTIADNSLINDRQHEMSQIYQAQMVELFGSNETDDATGEVNGQHTKDTAMGEKGEGGTV